MYRPKRLFLLLAAFSFIFLGSLSSYAYYSSEYSAVKNSFSISRILYLSFDSGGGNGTMDRQSLPLTADSVLPSCKFTKTGYKFKGWSTASGGAVLADTSALNKASGSSTALTLYAGWSPISYTVSFKDNTGSGTLPKSMSCGYDTGYDIPVYSTAASEDTLFTGWSTAADGTAAILSPSSRIYNLSTSDGAVVTLYAQWEDESSDIIEPNWDRRLELDSNNNGTADRLELKSGGTCIKDPSVKNHTSKDCYGYVMISVPTVSARRSGDSSAKVYDLAVPDITSHWKLVSSSVSNSTDTKSVYIYRYDTVLKAHGSTALSANHSLRHADRSTDIMNSFHIPAFSSCPSVSASLDLKAAFIEASVDTSEADALAKKSLCP